MYANETKKTRDSRSYIEIYASLPEIGRRFLDEKFKEVGLSKMTAYQWAAKGTCPGVENCRKLQRCLRELWGLETSPETLFPPKKIRKALVLRMKDKLTREEAPVKIIWPSLMEENESE